MEKTNNPNIEFICTEPGVESTMPIIRSSEYKPSWLKKAAADFKNNGSLSMNTSNDDDATFKAVSNNNFKKEDNRHTVKCPGMQMWHNTGWIMRLPYDIKFEVVTNGEYWDFVASDQSTKKRPVTFHLKHSFYPFFENWPKNTMKKIVKFHLPWAARIPEGYKLLVLHPMYLDDNRFTTCNGIYDPQLGIADIGTVPLFWHSLEGQHTIAAGTPVAQFILIPKEEPNFKIIEEENDKKFQKEYIITRKLLSQSFNVNYPQIKEFWKKYGW
jgi:hypothetical protein